MPAGTQTATNAAAVWTDLVKLSPMVWVEGARVAVQAIQPVMDMYDVDPLDQFNRDYGSIASSGFGKVLTEGADYQIRVNNQGDTLSAAVVKRGDAFTITEDLVDGNKYRDIRLGMEDLGGSLFRTRARDATLYQYTFGFASSFTDAEGTSRSNGIAKGAEPVYDDTHTMADGSSFDNELADAALGESNLRSLEDLTVNFLDENGIPVTWGLGGKVLITSEDIGMEHTAKRLTIQPWELDSTNRNMNLFSDARAHGGAFAHLPLHYLPRTAAGKLDTTKDKYYFINDRNLAKRSMIFSDHTRPTPRGPFEDMFNGGMLWRSKTRYDIGTLYAHHGAGCPATT
jgi:hypothetical protein